MEIARTVAKRGTCLRESVGAVVVAGTSVMSTGYNGAPSGELHCLDVGCDISIDHGGCMRTIHAEINALSGYYVQGQEAVIYCTHTPCHDCALEISRRDIEKVYFETEYGDVLAIAEFLTSLNIELWRVTPNGTAIRWPKTGS